MAAKPSIADVKDWDSLPGWARAFASAFVVVTALGALLAIS